MSTKLGTGYRKVAEIMSAMERRGPKLENQLGPLVDWIVSETGSDRGFLVIPTQRDPFHVRVHRMPGGAEPPKDDVTPSRPLVQRAIARGEAIHASHPFTTLHGRTESTARGADDAGAAAKRTVRDRDASRRRREAPGCTASRSRTSRLVT